MSVTEAADALKALGLSTYEAHAYVALLLSGTAEAGEVASRAGVPIGRIYDTLQGLVEKKLVLLQDTRPKQYRALAPRIAMSNLLGIRRKDLEDRYGEMTRVAGEIEKRLSPRVRDKASSFYHVSVGESETRAFLADKVREAEREILVNLAFKRYDPQDELLFAAFESAVARGVSTRVLLRDADVPYIIESPYNELVTRTLLPNLGKSLHVRVTDGEQVPFGVIDGEKAMIGVRNPLDPDVYFALVFVWDPKFGGDLRARFEALWKDSKLDVAGMMAEE